MNNKGMLILGSVLFFGAGTTLWAFSANRFLISEIAFIGALGALAGVGLGLAIFAVISEKK